MSKIATVSWWAFCVIGKLLQVDDRVESVRCGLLKAARATLIRGCVCTNAVNERGPADIRWSSFVFLFDLGSVISDP
jgi:hypothetical protein